MASFPPFLDLTLTVTLIPLKVTWQSSDLGLYDHSTSLDLHIHFIPRQNEFFKLSIFL